MVLGASPVGEVLAPLAHVASYTVATACKAEDASVHAGADRLCAGFELDHAAEPASVIVMVKESSGGRMTNKKMGGLIFWEQQTEPLRSQWNGEA